MTTNFGTRALAAAATLACAFWAAPAAAQDRGLLDDRFVLSLGTFLLDTKTEIGLNGSAGQAGTIIDLERDLGVGDATRFRFDGMWRINDRHHLRALWFDVSRESSRAIDRQLVIGDTTYPVNATVTANVDVTVYELAYEYAFVNRDDLEVAGSIGAHILDFTTGLRGNGTVNGQPVTGATESGDVTAPLPVIGVRGLWRFADDWYLEAQGQYFQVKLDQIDGSLSDLRLGVTWMFTEHFGAGAGWNRFNINADLSKNSFNGSLDWTYSGAQIYITGAF